MFTWGGSATGQERPVEQGGRCDNLVWKQHGNGTTMCSKTYSPDTIKWILDYGKMPELSKLPDTLQEKMKVTDKMQVYIPWGKNASFFVPQCKDAYFLTKNNYGTEVRVPANYLFNDNGLECEMVVKKSTAYGTTYRPKNADTLYDFATTDDPKCNPN
jgi:hypothetical protein